MKDYENCELILNGEVIDNQVKCQIDGSKGTDKKLQYSGTIEVTNRSAILKEFMKEDMDEKIPYELKLDNEYKMKIHIEMSLNNIGSSKFKFESSGPIEKIE
jgi:hypothetical protein